MFEVIAYAISALSEPRRLAVGHCPRTPTLRRYMALTPAHATAATAGLGDAPAAAAARRERRALAIARGAAATALFGSFIYPSWTNLAAVVMIVSFLLLPSARQRLRVAAATPLARMALVLLAVLAVATLWSDADLVTRLRAWRDWRPVLLLVFLLAIFDEVAARRRALLAFIGVAAIGLAYSWWTWLNGYSAVSNNHGMPGIVLRNPVTQGMAFAVACFLALMLAITQRDLHRRLRGALVAVALVLAANLAFVTSSRSAHLLLLILLAAAAVQGLRGWRRVAALAVLPVIAVLAFGASPMLQSRYQLLVEELRAPLASEELSSMGIRSVMWSVSGRMVVDRPLLGYGMGGFGPAYERAVQESSLSGWAATPTADPHNQFLQVQLQAGIAGTAAFIGFLIAAFRQPAPHPYRAWASALLLGWCATSLASSHFTTFAESHMIMLLLGMLLAPERAPPRADLAAEAPRSRAAAR